MTRPYKKKIPENEVYIPLLDMNFQWMPDEVEKVIDMWEKGYHLQLIADEINREGDEVMILLLDLARKSQIEKRENSIWGWRL